MKKSFFSLIILLISLYFLIGGQRALAQSTLIQPGIVLPQMTTAQRTAVASPTDGMLVFDTNTQSYWFRQSGTWVELNGGSSTNYWQLNGANGNEITNTNSGGFWSRNATAVTSDPGVIAPPVSGAGTRLMWIPSKSAFRVGTVVSTEWDAANIGTWSFAWGLSSIASGNYSTAMGVATNARSSFSTAMGISTTAIGTASTVMGYNTTASGSYSTAMGQSTIASGIASTAMGYNTNASGNYSTAMGNSTASGEFSIAIGGSTASGRYSTAMGSLSTARGTYSTAMGDGSTASGEASTAMGDGSTASGDGSTAMGSSIASGYGSTAMGSSTASGRYSTAMGYGASTNNKVYSFAIGRGFSGDSPLRAINDKDRQMKMHFDEFQFLTGNTNHLTITDGTISTSNILTVSGVSNVTLSGYGYLNRTFPTGIHNPTNGVDYSIYANNRVLAEEFAAFSDARHKRVLPPGNGANDLALLNRLQVSRYTFIDTVAKGNQVKLGFIAQQVEQVVPEAITKIQDYIPSVYALATRVVVDTLAHTLTVTTPKSHDFIATDAIKLIGPDQDYKVTVARVMDAHTFVVHGWEKPVAELFVFGKQVNDFRTVDYDRLFTLGISSIQELSRQVKAQQAKIERLEAENAKSEVRLGTLEAKLESLLIQREKEGMTVSAKK